MRRCGKRIRRVLCQSHHRRDQTYPRTKAPVISATSSPAHGACACTVGSVTRDPRPAFLFSGGLTLPGIRAPSGVNSACQRVSNSQTLVGTVRGGTRGKMSIDIGLQSQNQTKEFVMIRHVTIAVCAMALL